MLLRCPHIERGTFLCQSNFAGSARIYLVQTDSGSLCKFFVTDARALQTTEHPHCFVLYGHLFVLHLFYFSQNFSGSKLGIPWLWFLYFDIDNILLPRLLYLLFNGRANARTALPLFLLCFAVGGDHCIHFLLKRLVEKQSTVADNLPRPQILNCKI